MGDPTAVFGAELDGAPSLFSVAFDLAAHGYSVHEFLVSGTATSYEHEGPREPDGRWAVKEAGHADYTTRIVVYRPGEPARSNGTTVVEWLNVTGGLDIPAVWMPTHRHLMREGYTWVGVTAQRVGVEGGGMMPGLGLRSVDPERYGKLVHPGDEFSYDIFTQVARAVRERFPSGRAIATGASQSAFHLTTYVNAVDPAAAVFDGFLLQGRAGAGAPIEGWVFAQGHATDVDARLRRLRGRDHIRADARVPVIVVQSETDVFGGLQYLPARQPDGDRFRLWEVAGAAHCDTYFLCAAAFDDGTLPIGELAALIARADNSGMPTPLPINSGPQMHYVLQGAVAALDRWMRDGTEPASGARIASSDAGKIVTDDLGIARGGVRSPWVDAPLAVLSGLGQPADMTELFGTTLPIENEVLAARYPGGRAEYVDQFRASLSAAVDAGFILVADADEVAGLGVAAWS